VISRIFYVCFNIETGAIEAIFKRDGDAIDFKNMYPAVVSEPQGYKITLDMEPVIIPKPDIPNVQYLKGAK